MERAAREREEERLGRERVARQGEMERLGRERAARVGGRVRREREVERLGREREFERLGRERVVRGRSVYCDCPSHCLPCPTCMESASTPPTPCRSGRVRCEPCRYQSVDFRR